MKHRPIFAIFSGFSALALAIVACGGSPAEPTATKAVKEATATKEASKPTATKKAADPTKTPKPTSEPQSGGNPTTVEEGQIGVNSFNVYIDDYGYFHVAGEIHNRLDTAVDSVELSVAVVDADDKTVLTESDEPVDTIAFSPHTYYIGAGEFATFDYYFSPEDDAKPEEWKATVAVTDFDETKVDRAKVTFENTFTYVDEDGHIYLTGEIVNQEDKPIMVRSLSGAMTDENEAVLGAAYGYNNLNYLYPAGTDGLPTRTPYFIKIYGPLADGVKPFIYADVEITDYKSDPDVKVALQDVDANSFYVDQYDDIHLVTAVTNKGDEAINVRLVASLYNEAGKVLDADSESILIYVHPGETVPVVFDSFYSANSNDEVREAVARYRITIDDHPYSTYAVSYETLNLAADEAIKDETSKYDDGSLIFEGTFVNPSETKLSYAYILVVIADKATGNIVSAGYTSVSPEGEAFAQGDESEFTIYLQLDPSVDAKENYEYYFLVQGYPKD